MSGFRTIVTGGAGFIGSHLVDALIERGDEVLVLDDLSTGSEANLNPKAEFRKLDLRDREGVFRAFRAFSPELVFHQAAQASVSVSVREPAYDAEVNLMGGLYVLEAAREVGVRHFVFASTGGAIYGEVPEGERASEDWPPRPKSPYAASKAGFEYYLEVFKAEFGLPYTSLRYGNVYGPRQNPHGEAGVVAIFATRILRGEPVVVFAGETLGDAGGIRDYIHVADVVSANLLAADRGLVGVYNVGTGEGHTTEEVLWAIAGALDAEPEVKYAERRPGDLYRSVLDPGKLAKEGWRVTRPFDKGIAETALAFREAFLAGRL